MKQSILLSIFLICGCVTNKIDKKQFSKINFETNKDKAILIIGNPRSGGIDKTQSFESLFWQDNINGCNTAMKITWIKNKVQSITIWSNFETNEIWKTVKELTKAQESDWVEIRESFYFNKTKDISLQIDKSSFVLMKVKDHKIGTP